MSGFAAEWLALREPYDARARNPTILDAAVASLSSHASVTLSIWDAVPDQLSACSHRVDGAAELAAGGQ